MKKTTCQELQGACDAEITGNTPEEMGENSKNHVMEMIRSGDEAHKNAMEDMMKLSTQEQQAWYENFVKNFNSLPDA